MTARATAFHLLFTFFFRIGLSIRSTRVNTGMSTHVTLNAETPSTTFERACISCGKTDREMSPGIDAERGSSKRETYAFLRYEC